MNLDDINRMVEQEAAGIVAGAREDWPNHGPDPDIYPHFYSFLIDFADGAIEIFVDDQEWTADFGDLVYSRIERGISRGEYER